MLNENEQSDFNMAIAWLQNLRFLFTLANYHAQNYDADGWLSALVTLYRELITEMKEEEKERYKQISKDLLTEIKQNQRNNRRKGQDGIHPDLYWKLNDYDVFLREVMDRKGLLKRVSDDAMKALR